jgi:hypothetical protein
MSKKSLCTICIQRTFGTISKAKALPVTGCGVQIWDPDTGLEKPANSLRFRHV